MAQRANAYPRKHFFFEMFTRDISLQACILDLIDNSIDGLIRTGEIDVSAEILKPVEALSIEELAQLPTISVTYGGGRFSISDECGGITRRAAKEDVFTFGHDLDTAATGQLGVYGIGLKRAIFKIGDMLEMSSRTEDEGWQVKVNLRDWAKEDESLDDWTFPLTILSGTSGKQKPGTAIVLTRLHAEVTSVLAQETWTTLLIKEIARTYCYFLDRYVRITVNGEQVLPERIPLAESPQIKAGVDHFKSEGVEITLVAGLNDPKQAGQDRSGWYVLCNARVTVSGDKTELTGWGNAGLPTFHSKYVRFVGLAFFHATDPIKLPWTTTKRGLNRESNVYLAARSRMSVISRPVLTFLNRMYPSDQVAEYQERVLADGVREVDARTLVKESSRVFQATPAKKKQPKSTIRISYDAKISQIDAIAKHVRKSLKPSQIGEMTFQYYLDEEGLK